MDSWLDDFRKESSDHLDKNGHASTAVGVMVTKGEQNGGRNSLFGWRRGTSKATGLIALEVPSL